MRNARIQRWIARLSVVVLALAMGSVLGASAANAGSEPSIGGECPAFGDPIEPTSVEQIEDLLVGTWLHCGPKADLALGDEVGFEVVDDQYYRVYQAADGSLIRAGGAGQEGVIGVIDLAALGATTGYQLDVRVLAAGTMTFHPTFYATPTALELAGMVGIDRYVQWDGPSPVPGVPPGAENDPCGVIRDPIEVTSVEQVNDLLAGTWLLCSQPADLAPGEVGFQIVDGHYYRVYQPTDGGPWVRATGAGQEGIVTVDDMSSSDRFGYQVNIELLGAGSLIMHPTFFDSPPSMLDESMLGNVAYLRWAGPEPVPGQAPAGTSPLTLDVPVTGIGTALVLVALGVTALGAALAVLARRPTGDRC
jgi:hypothetical protein